LEEEEEEEEEEVLAVRLIRAEAQLDFIVDKMEGILKALGGALDQVVRTRVYVQSEELIAAVAACHGRRFAEVRFVVVYFNSVSFSLCFFLSHSFCFFILQDFTREYNCGCGGGWQSIG
jgi:hypothetical protein